MSTTTTSPSDSLSSSVPKLESTGMNWAIFSVHFQDAVEAKGFWGHFDGTTTCPVIRCECVYARMYTFCQINP